MSGETESSISPRASAIRWISIAHVAVLAGQLGLATLFISGYATSYIYHAQLAWAVTALGVIQAAAILAPGGPRLGGLYSAMAIIIALSEFGQIILGRAAQTSFHITLAMIIWGLSLAVMIRALDPAWGLTAPSDRQ